MKPWTVGIAAIILFIAKPACAQQSRPVRIEGGVVMGIIAEPYVTVGIVRAPWSIRVSGGDQPNLVNCYGLQVNVGRVLKDEGNAKHTVGAIWAGFRNACWYQTPFTATRNRQIGGQYFGVAYDFQVKGLMSSVSSLNASSPSLHQFRPVSAICARL